VCLLLPSCGTYSVLRPADNLAEGRFEVQAGAAISTVPELLPVLKADVGITDWLEAGAQWEVYNALVGARIGLLKSETHGIALAIGVQAGLADIARLEKSSSQWSNRFVISPNVTIGRRFNKIELYLGTKALLAVSDFAGTEVFTAKLGLRWTANELGFITVEGGASAHRFLGSGYLFVGEGSGSIGVSF